MRCCSTDFTTSRASTTRISSRSRRCADSKGVQIRIGAGGISQGASSFKPTEASPEEAHDRRHSRRHWRSAHPRSTAASAPSRIATRPAAFRRASREAVTTLKAIKSRAQDAGLKFAFENHAGDTRSEEVLDLIEAAGTDFCGVMLDPGNALWAMEDPMEQLQKLGPHVLCSSVRDYTVWVSEDGAMFQWTARPVPQVVACEFR